MAKVRTGRMISSGLPQNLKYGKLSDPARVLYGGMIIKADDDGRFRADPLFLKANMFPYDDKSVELIQKLRDEIVVVGLIKIYEVDGQIYGYHPSWTSEQHIRSDRYVRSELPYPLEQLLLTIDDKGIEGMTTKRQPDDNQEGAQVKLSKVKLSKVKLKKTPDRSAPVLQLQDYFYEKLKTKFDKPDFNYSMAGKKFKELLKTQNVDDIKLTIDSFFNTKEEFYIKKGYDIRDFSSQYNAFKKKKGGKYDEIMERSRKKSIDKRHT